MTTIKKTASKIPSRPAKKPAKAAPKAAAPVAPKKKTAVRKPAEAGIAAKAVTAASKRQAALAARIADIVVAALDDMKAQNVKVLDVRKQTDVTDTLVLASGTSDRHVRSIADRVIEKAKAAGHRPLGVEGQRDGEWVLVDLQDVIVHVMLPRVREFYGLEKLWEVPSPRVAAVP